jgi:hypothetical protein
VRYALRSVRQPIHLGTNPLEPSRILSSAPPISLILGGKEYRIGRIRPRDIGNLENWFKEVVPNPRSEARKAMEGLPVEVQIHIWDEASREARHWPPRFGDEIGQELIRTSEGIARLVHLSISQSVAGFTLDDARDLANEMDFDELARFLKAIFPDAEDDTEAPGSGPKAESGPAPSHPTGTP